MELLRRAVMPALAAALACGCAAPETQLDNAVPDYALIVAAPNRSNVDRANDARRKPEQMLAFIGLRRGMKVLDLGAGAGYSTELLARVVGPQGVVYAQNSPQTLQGQTKARLDERMKTPAMKNVEPVLRDFSDPVPPDAHGLDVVTFFYIYHDTPAWDIDRVAMNQRIFDALKPGGIYVIADHAARDGAGVSEARSLHRIEQSVLRREVEAAGFSLAAEADFLRNPADTREERVFTLRIPVDNFVLKFVKP